MGGETVKKSWNISDSEWLVLRCLWKKKPLEIKELTAMLKEETGWTSNMVRAMVVRLLEKGAIGVEKRAHYFRYYPIAEEEACVKEETESFLNRVFERSVPKLFAALTDNRKLSAAELEELEQMIRKLKAEE